MNIQFNNIVIKNFLSFEDTSLDFNDFPGYISIIGENKNPNDNAKSNGSGKSALFDALCWALTGETVRGVKDVKNIFTDGDACVELDFYIDNNHYKIIRTKGKSSTLKLVKNDIDISGKGVRDTEEILKQTLGDVDKTLIGSVILLGQGMPDRFSNNTPSGRKEVLENLSKSNFMIEDLSNKISDRLTNLKDDYNTAQGLVYKYQYNVEAIKNQLDYIETDLNDAKLVDNLKETLANLESEFESSKQELETINNNIYEETNKLNQLREEYIEARSVVDEKIKNDTAGLRNQLEYEQNEINSINAKISVFKAEINKIKAIKDVCPTCGQKIQGVHKPDTTAQENEVIKLNNNLAAHKDKFLELQKQIAETESNIKSATNKLLELSVEKGKNQKLVVDKLVNDKNVIQEHYNSCSIQINSQKAKIELHEKNKYDLLAKKAEYENQLVIATQEAEENNKQLENIEKRLEIVKKFSTVISRDFRGILLEDIIDYLNKIIAKYSITVFGHSNLKLELNKNNLDIIYSDKYYEGLSGGEKQKVDVIIQFALRYMLCNMLNFSCNIIVLDEVFDNCDIEGCNKLIELISNELADIKSVFIVTHHNFELQLPTDYDIIITKGADGISRLSV